MVLIAGIVSNQYSIRNSSKCLAALVSLSYAGHHVLGDELVRSKG
jgi:hypothetical protein